MNSPDRKLDKGWKQLIRRYKDKVDPIPASQLSAATLPKLKYPWNFDAVRSEISNVLRFAIEGEMPDLNTSEGREIAVGYFTMEGQKAVYEHQQIIHDNSWGTSGRRTNLSRRYETAFATAKLIECHQPTNLTQTNIQEADEQNTSNRPLILGGDGAWLKLHMRPSFRSAQPK